LSDHLDHSMFREVLFPTDSTSKNDDQDLTLRRLKRFVPKPSQSIIESTIIVFDLETTGLDSKSDRIIEIGAIKLVNLEPVAEFSTLVSTDIEISPTITNITGLTQQDLVGQPQIEPVLNDFLDFIDGGILVAHNADFDMPMVKAHYSRMGIDLEWPTFCTLKMARRILEHLENKKLDTIAEHYGLTFESRHRSIGDVKVTIGVLQGMLNEAKHLKTWADLAPYTAK
jgi:DNA polymerase III subunit epsilon